MSAALRAWWLVGLLLALCLAHGLSVTRGMAVPPDTDMLRDIGFAQGLLDGNWLGDPATGGAVRYYPPLVPALGAAVGRLAGAGDLPSLWLALGPWFGLLPVIAFFLFARAVLPGTAGLARAVVFVLWNGALAKPWIGGGYSPWLLTPVLAQVAFLGVAWLIHRRGASERWRDAVLVGAAIGAAGLAHLVPAMLLTVMVVAVAWAERGMNRRSMAWLALAGLAAAVVIAPYLLPLLLAHPQGVAHAEPAQWVADELRPMIRRLGALAVLNGPWLVAAVLLWRWHAWPARRTVVLLVAWMGACLLALASHYACMGAGGVACRLMVVPAHHFHLYLQVGGACLIGLALAALPRRLAGLLLLAGVVALWLRPWDTIEHAAVRDFDMPAYRWIRGHVPPTATFVTAMPTDADEAFDPASQVVMAAGRRMVAMHALFSNPFVPWAPREALRLQAMVWLVDAAAPPPCALRGQDNWAMLPLDEAALPGRATVAFATAENRLLRLNPIDCERR